MSRTIEVYDDSYGHVAGRVIEDKSKDRTVELKNLEDLKASPIAEVLHEIAEELRSQGKDTVVGVTTPASVEEGKTPALALVVDAQYKGNFGNTVYPPRWEYHAVNVTSVGAQKVEVSGNTSLIGPVYTRDILPTFKLDEAEEIKAAVYRAMEKPRTGRTIDGATISRLVPIEGFAVLPRTKPQIPSSR